MATILKEEKKEISGVVIENLIHDSKSLLKTSYNYNTNQLVVTFQKGNVYQYHEVPKAVYESLKSADSSGSFFQKNIAKSFTYKLLANIDPQTILKELE